MFYNRSVCHLTHEELHGDHRLIALPHNAMSVNNKQRNRNNKQELKVSHFPIIMINFC